MGGVTVYIPVTDEMLDAFARIAEGKQSHALAARQLGMNESTLRMKYKKWARQKGIEKPTAPTPSTVGLTGICLKSLRTSPKKPQESVRTRLYELTEGMAYKVEDLCREWHVQPDTLTKHAKAVNAFIYAEISPENWVPVITRPKQ